MTLSVSAYLSSADIGRVPRALRSLISGSFRVEGDDHRLVGRDRRARGDRGPPRRAKRGGGAGAPGFSERPVSARRAFSRNLRRTCRHTGISGAIGSASELDRDVPFWCSPTSLDEYVRGLPRGFFAGLDGAVLAQLAYVLSASQTWPRTLTLLMAMSAYRSPSSGWRVLTLDREHAAGSRARRPPLGRLARFELLLTLLRRPSTTPMVMSCRRPICSRIG